MRIERPRSPQMVTITIRGKAVERPKVGYAQFQMLGLLAKVGASEPPPKGVLTATGVLREHILNDMIPLGWVRVRNLRPGVTEYALTKLGDFARKHGVVQTPPKTAKASPLLDRQRARARARSAPPAVRARMARSA